jgi:hypothetical protein
VNHRSSHAATEPQNAPLVITIADPPKAAPVYNEVVLQTNKIGWDTSDLLVETRGLPQRKLPGIRSNSLDDSFHLKASAGYLSLRETQRAREDLRNPTLWR